MYSDISRQIMAIPSSKRYSARAWASSILPPPVGPKKMKRPMGRLGFARPARLADGLRDGDHSGILADHALVQRLLYREEPLGLIFEHSRYGDAAVGTHRPRYLLPTYHSIPDAALL